MSSGHWKILKNNRQNQFCFVLIFKYSNLKIEFISKIYFFLPI